jgi:hypothetical protein
MPGASPDDGFDRPEVEATAKTLIERAVFVEPHSGHGILSTRALSDLTSFSKRVLQAEQVYS